MNCEVLNKLQALLITFANERGISLHAEFGTVENFKTFVVAFAIKSLVDAGLEIAKAYDFILGNGEYDKLVEATWNAAQ